jgi:hypothetical protein
MPTQPTPEILVARESFVGRLGDEEVFVRAGELFAPNHPWVRNWPDKFAPAVIQRSKVEQATRAPGEVRS